MGGLACVFLDAEMFAKDSRGIVEPGSVNLL